MADLYWGVAVMLLLAGALAVVGKSVGRRLKKGAAIALVTAAMGLLVAQVFWLADGLWLCRLLPFSNVPVTGNWALPLAGLALGMTWSRMSGGLLRRLLMLGALAGLGLYSVLSPLLHAPPDCRDRWWDGVICHQTRPGTCAPAAAATLLRAHGIEAREGEMARLCLTRDKGTSMHGLYRGLKLKTAGTDRAVAIVGGDIEHLRAAVATTPVLISVELRPGEKDDRYERQWGWNVGVPHTVVLYRFCEDGRLDIGDPSVGREYWDLEALRTLWHGQGLQLVQRR
jgi:hypothetical protein